MRTVESPGLVQWHWWLVVPRLWWFFYTEPPDYPSLFCILYISNNCIFVLYVIDLHGWQIKTLSISLTRFLYRYPYKLHALTWRINCRRSHCSPSQKNSCDRSMQHMCFLCKMPEKIQFSHLLQTDKSLLGVIHFATAALNRHYSPQ